MRTHRIHIAFTVLAFLLAGRGAGAQSTFSVECTDNQFTIHRSSKVGEETVYYHTVSLSAFAGAHFIEVNGSYTFPDGEDDKVITVTEGNPSNSAYRFQNGTTRSYRFELTDANGNYLNHVDRVKTIGTEVPSSGAFQEKKVTIQSQEYWADDRGYDKNGYKAVSSSEFYNNAAPQSYYSAVGAQLRMTLSLEAKEDDDSYQYLQLLFSNTSTCDDRSGCGNGNPGNLDLSSYMACFEHDRGHDCATYYKYTFPELSVGNYDGTRYKAWTSLGNTVGDFTAQKFKSGSRAIDGRLVVPLGFTRIVLRLNASGSTGSDKWYARNVYAHIQAVDNTRPTVLARKAAPAQREGNNIYVSIAFSEIVTLTGNVRKLNTNWGALNYEAGSGSNVLTFKGVIPENAPSLLNITGLDGTIADLAGNELPAGAVNADNLCSLYEGNEYAITYDLDGGSIAVANPDKYTYGTSVTINQVPVRPGYRFAGWTGSNGNTPQTTVIILANEHHDKSYTANWIPLWGQGQDADGSQDHPYVISTTEGLDMLAKVVDGLDGYTANGYSGTYFELGGDIVYNTTGLGGEQCNFTQIGGYFNGSDKDFCGSLDGKGYRISGIRLIKPLESDNVNKNVGLFGRTTDANIQHVTISGAVFRGYSFVGGIVGNSANSTVKDCLVLNSSIAFQSKNAGVILGKNNGCSLSANYYRNCTVTAGNSTASLDVGIGGNSTTASDQSGARSIHTLTLGENITATGTSVLVGNVTYYASNTFVTLSYDSVPDGSHVHYSYNDGETHAVSGSMFTMPAADITVSAVVSSAADAFALTQGTKDGVSAYWGTFYDSGFNYTLSEGAAAYTMGSDYRLYRLGEDGRTIPKGTAVVIMAIAPGVTLTCTGSEKLDITIHGGKNILFGNDVAQTYASLSVLALGTSGEVNFFILHNALLPAYKAGYTPPTEGGLQDYDKQTNQKW